MRFPLFIPALVLIKPITLVFADDKGDPAEGATIFSKLIEKDRVAGFEGHPTGASDFKAQLTKVLQGRPDLIYISDYYNDAALIARQARELGFKGPLMGGDGWDSPRLPEIAGPTLEPA